MPWIYNPSRDAQLVKMQDGVVLGFPPRQKIYVTPANMSAEAWRLVQSGQLINRAGDPVVQAPVLAPAVVPPSPVTSDNSVTSSSHHQADARVSVNSSIADLEKESKSEKKQIDEGEKATSDTSEVVTKSDDKKSERRSRRSRRGQ